MKKITETHRLNISLVEIILSEEKCGEGMYWCNTNKECKPLPSGFNTPGQTIKPTEVGIGKPVEGSCNHTKKGKSCSVHGTRQCPMSEEKAAARKRREDPNPNRKGDTINVKTESKIYEDHKEIASGKERDGEGYMARTELDTITKAVASLRKNIKKGNTQLPAWVQSKITKAADYIDTAADYLDSDEVNEEKDACYSKVKSRYSVWPSAYASGALVKCRKVGAKNWGNKSKNEEIVYEGDYWHPDPEMDRKLGGPGPNQRAREDNPQPKSDPKKLRKGESYMDWNKRQRGLKNSYEPDGELIDESTRLQAETGNILAVILNWRGKTYSVRMFFPQVGMPNRKDVTTEIQKIYPSALVLQYKVSSLQPGMPLIQVVNSKSKNYLLNNGTIGEEKIEEEGPVLSVGRGEKLPVSKGAGLTAKGREKYNRKTGSNLQAPVTGDVKPGSKAAKRRKAFCSRSISWKGERGLAARRRWKC